MIHFVTDPIPSQAIVIDAIIISLIFYWSDLLDNALNYTNAASKDTH